MGTNNKRNEINFITYPKIIEVIMQRYEICVRELRANHVIPNLFRNLIHFLRNLRICAKDSFGEASSG